MRGWGPKNRNRATGARFWVRHWKWRRRVMRGGRRVVQMMWDGGGVVRSRNARQGGGFEPKLKASHRGSVSGCRRQRGALWGHRAPCHGNLKVGSGGVRKHYSVGGGGAHLLTWHPPASPTFFSPLSPLLSAHSYPPPETQLWAGCPSFVVGSVWSVRCGRCVR